MALGIGFGYYAYYDHDLFVRTLTRLAGEDPGFLGGIWAYFRALLSNRIFDLFVNRTYSVMANDTLTAIPLFLFMGYIVERANIVNRLFRSLQIASRALPGSLAVAALVTCALFATATGIVGAVVTLLGLLALPAMLRARYDVPFATGAICAGGCLGILIPPSIMLIVYGATAGVSVVRLYAGALLPGFMLAGLYVVYVVTRAWLNPKLAPKMTDEEAGNVSTLQVLWMLLTSFFPLAFLILAVLGAILFGLATPSEAAALGALGGIVLAAAYGALTWERLQESVYLTVRTTAMVCWLFVGSGVLRRGLRLSRRAGGHRQFRHRARPHAAAVPASRAGHHLPARLAARMDGDHHHLHPDLPAAAGALRDRSALLRHPGRAQSADGVPVAADGDVGLLSEGHLAARGAAQRRSSTAACPTC